MSPLNKPTNHVIWSLSNISVWEFKEATLIRLIGNSTEVQTGDEGLLYVTLVNKQTEEEKKGMVCDDYFNQQSARLFCKNMGYDVKEGVFGKYEDPKYVPK